MISIIIRAVSVAVRIIPASAIVGFLGYLGLKKITEKDKDRC